MGFFDTTPSACFIDDLLNFNIDETDALITNRKPLLPHSADVFTSPECEDEEELEWLSNEDAFPSVETFVPCVEGETFDDMMSLESSTTSLKHESPVSVLENSNSSFGSTNSNYCNAIITSCCSGRGLAPPIRRPRSKGSRRRLRGGFIDVPSQQWFVLCRIEANKPRSYVVKASETNGLVAFRKCKHCGSEKTPQWRAGPDGPKTLCNACGVRYKSGRLCPEYRPANSPTFSSAVHSSSHRKIIEMRKMKQVRNITVNSVDND